MYLPRMNDVCRTVLVALGLLWAPGAASGQTLTVAAASDLQSALPVIAAQFEKDTGQNVTLTFGSSGNFFAQIQNGAPFDVFLSADIDYPRRLESAGLDFLTGQHQRARSANVAMVQV